VHVRQRVTAAGNRHESTGFREKLAEPKIDLSVLRSGNEQGPVRRHRGAHRLCCFQRGAVHETRTVASASERNQRTFITMKVRSSYCSASRIQSFISSDSRALISLAGR